MLGHETPRLSTPPLRELTPETSLGFLAIEFAEQVLHMTLLPWQKVLLIHVLELRESGLFRFRQVVILCSRQNGKTSVMKVLALFLMYAFPAYTVMASAQDLRQARDTWEEAVDLAEEYLEAELPKVRRGSGDQMLKLTRNGSRYLITAANGKAGRGKSVDLVLLDELREHHNYEAWDAISATTTARRNPLILAFSNAGDEDSVVLNDLRGRALGGNSEQIGIFEWSAPEGCELDDREAWAAANPGLGHTITEDALLTFLAGPVSTFRTEHLCQTVPAYDNALDVAAWRVCADPKGALDVSRSRVALCLDISPDMQHISLVAAAMMDDGRVRVELLDTWHSTPDARVGLADWVTRIKPRKVGWFPGGPSAALAPDLRRIKRNVELKAGDVPAVCQGFAEQIAARQVLHSGQERLAAQVAGASRLVSGDGWRFTRKGMGHVESVYAAAGAVHLARTMPARASGPLYVAPRSKAS